MHGTYRLFDFVLLAFLAGTPVLDRLWVWPRFLARLSAGVEGARLKFYRNAIYGEWVPTLCLLGFWRVEGRAWAWLRLDGIAPARLGAGLAAAVLVVILLRLQNAAVLSREKARRAVRQKLEYAEPLLPHAPAERALFRALSVSAGICEEILFRGFLLWMAAAWAGPVAGVILSSLLFGLGHIYLGFAQVPKTAILGVILACLVMGCGSLWPAMLIHAAVDWHSGDLGYSILRADAAKD